MKNEFVEQMKGKLFADIEQIIALSCGLFGSEASQKVIDVLDKYDTSKVCQG